MCWKKSADVTPFSIIIHLPNFPSILIAADCVKYSLTHLTTSIKSFVSYHISSKIDTVSRFKMAAAAIFKIQLNVHNSVIVAHIRTKFGSETKTDVPETEIPPNFTSAKIQDGGRPPFWKHINHHNSAARWAIFTKFGVEVDTGSPWLPVTSNFTSQKSKMAAGAILKIHLNGHNSVAIAHIRTKFGSETETDVPDTEIPPSFTAAKIQDGARLPFWKHINHHNSAAR